jgi:hypothetical protein
VEQHKQRDRREVDRRVLFDGAKQNRKDVKRDPFALEHEVDRVNNEEGQELVDKIFDACGTELKTELLSFCLCFMAVDETISREETAFVKRLLD